MKDSDHPSDRGPAAGPAGSTSLSLLDRAKGGEETAWQQLVFVYRPLVRWWCRRHGVDRPEDVEDVSQEVFVTVFSKLADFRREATGGFRSWLFTITRLKALEYHRIHRKPQAAGGSAALAQLHNVPDAPDDGSTEEELQSERAILTRRAMELIRPEFKSRTWETVWRVVVEGRSPKEVAAELGLSVGAVYVAKSRVLGRLREMLDDLHV